MRRLACSMTAKTYRRAPDSVLVSKKSHARRASAGERRKVAQVVCARPGAGSMSCSLRISRAVEASCLRHRRVAGASAPSFPDNAAARAAAELQRRGRDDLALKR